MIRDVYTLILMLVAQVVCVLLGFVVERVMENGMTCSIVQQIEVSDFGPRPSKPSVVGPFLRLCLFARFYGTFLFSSWQA